MRTIDRVDYTTIEADYQAIIRDGFESIIVSYRVGGLDDSYQLRDRVQVVSYRYPWKDDDERLELAGVVDTTGTDFSRLRFPKRRL